MFSKEIASSKVPLPKTMLTQLIEHEEVKLGPMYNLHAYILESLAQEGFLQATKRET